MVSSSPGRSHPLQGDYPDLHGYMSRVEGSDIVEILARQMRDTQRLLESIDESRADHRYAPGKWSIKQVIGHLADVERVHAYRALAFARGERQDLPAFEQDDYVREAGFDRRQLRDLSDELLAVRTASIALFETFDDAVGRREGKIAGKRVVVRAIPFVIAGHELHHVAILQERYL